MSFIVSVGVIVILRNSMQGLETGSFLCSPSCIELAGKIICLCVCTDVCILGHYLGRADGMDRHGDPVNRESGPCIEKKKHSKETSDAFMKKIYLL